MGTGYDRALGHWRYSRWSAFCNADTRPEGSPLWCQDQPPDPFSARTLGKRSGRSSPLVYHFSFQNSMPFNPFLTLSVNIH